MTTSTTTAEERLAKLSIHLPDAPTPFGAYLPRRGRAEFTRHVARECARYGGKEGHSDD